ncbi:MAG: ASPIC/UnbV domain-containing protein, partial [Candidatus Poribacteria bacterium]|nr:ASPIC/UnbV domain-containing protein [Candidatus Poribacteria bacterium]
LLRNEGGNSNHWLTIQPIGTQSNTSGIGTKIVVKAGNLSLTKEARSGASYLSQSDLRVHFGLGENSAVDTLEIHWQGGLTERFSNMKSDQILRIKEGHGIIKGRE